VRFIYDLTLLSLATWIRLYSPIPWTASVTSATRARTHGFTGVAAHSPLVGQNLKGQ
jgi:hypothetical protein